MDKAYYKEYRCPNDDKLLFKGLLVDSTVEVKCKACKVIVILEGTPSDELICKKVDCQNRVV